MIGTMSSKAAQESLELQCAEVLSASFECSECEFRVEFPEQFTEQDVDQQGLQ
jgi:hypothetical protein